MQFSVRLLLFAVVPIAAFFAVARTAGYAVAAGTILALAMFVAAAFWRRRGRVVYLRLAAAVFALAVLWFLAVDWSWFKADCPDCLNHRDVAEYRVFCIPVHTQVVERPTRLQLVLKDLGLPCNHTNRGRWHKHRRWGLVLCACPCFDGTWSIDNTGDYTEEMASTVRQVGEENPQLAAELADLAIRKHDYATFWRKINRAIEGESGGPD
ncbi:MAG: hypothetical protein RIC55_22240 [Pirellulaceae bacterium]